jgi:hypothetical protein
MVSICEQLSESTVRVPARIAQVPRRADVVAVVVGHIRRVHHRRLHPPDARLERGQPREQTHHARELEIGIDAVPV